MTTSLFDILLGVFMIALAVGLLRSAVAMFKIRAGALPIYHLILPGWMAFVSVISFAVGVLSIAHGAFGIDMPFSP